MVTGVLALTAGVPMRASAAPGPLVAPRGSGEALLARTGGPGLPARKPVPGGGVTRGPDSIEVVSQSVWVGPGGELKFHLRISARHPAHEALQILVYGGLSARSQFQEALRGNAVGGPIFSPAPEPLTQLTADPAGGVDLDIPIGQPTSAQWPPSGTGVYPLQMFLEDASQARVGRPLDTFLVYAATSAADLKKLDVAVVVPFRARVPLNAQGQPGRVPVPTAAALEGDAQALGRPVPVTLAPDVVTLEALRTGPAGQQTAVAQLAAALRRGDQLLPSTELPVNMGELESSGFSGDLTEEVSSGLSALKSLLGQVPSTRTWAFLNEAGPSTLRAGQSQGGRSFVLPDQDLVGLPASEQDLTFAQPTELSLSGQRAQVLGADSELAQRVALASRRSPVLTAYQMLAELAMIDLEQPNNQRAVVVMPPSGVVVNPGFLGVLLGGLVGNPLLSPVTVERALAQVPMASAAGKPLGQKLAQTRPAGGVPGVGQLLAARAALKEDTQVLGSDNSTVVRLNDELIVSLSSWFSSTERRAFISDVLADARRQLHQVRLPPATSITLTSRQGQLPLTLSLDGPGPMDVLLVLNSAQLAFPAKRFAQGACRQVLPGTEHCRLVLTHTVTLNVPVVVRSIGTFPISLSIETPDGRQVITTRTDDVSSTAFSDVGLALMIGAAVFLAVWWARNARHGRRARKLVPRPNYEGGAGEVSSPAPAPS